MMAIIANCELKNGKWPTLGRQFVTNYSSLTPQDPLNPSQGLFFSPSGKT
jgi:hypothetical protein